MRCPVFVGRDVELAVLAEIFSQAASGRGACAVVTGEAGVGKTRLVTEAATGAREGEQVVLIGRSTPTDRVSPLRPLWRGAAGWVAWAPPRTMRSLGLTFLRWGPWCRTGQPVRTFRRCRLRR